MKIETILRITVDRLNETEKYEELLKDDDWMFVDVDGHEAVFEKITDVFNK